MAPLSFAAATRPGRTLGVGLFVIACVVAFGLLSARLGTDRNWDLRNYQVFGPFALLNGRMFHDLLAGQMQGFFNPLASLPSYLSLTVLEARPRLHAFVMGVPAGLFAAALALIALAHARAVLPGRPGLARVMAGLATLLAVTGAATLPAVGLSTGDIVTALPMLLAYGLVLCEAIARDGAPAHRARTGAMLLAGLLIGLSAGLKLTNVPYGAGLGVMILLLLGWRAALLAGTALAAGFLIAAGPHAWTLYAETGNPIFPMYNHLFRSPDLPPVAIADRRFLPRSMPQALFYPFWWLRRTESLVGELSMRDPRVALGYLAALAIPGLLLLRRAAGRRRAALLPLGMAAIAFLMWSFTFGIHRYLVLLEALAALLLMLALLLAFTARPWWAAFALGALLLASQAMTVRPNWGHGPHASRQILGVAQLPLPEGVLLVSLDDEPHGYLAARLPPGGRMIGLATNLRGVIGETGLFQRLRAIVANHPGPIHGVADPGVPEAQRAATLERFGLAIAGDCTLLRTGLVRGGHLLCPLERRAEAARPVR
jgi:hypothetical protein